MLPFTGLVHALFSTLQSPFMPGFSSYGNLMPRTSTLGLYIVRPWILGQDLKSQLNLKTGLSQALAAANNTWQRNYTGILQEGNLGFLGQGRGGECSYHPTLGIWLRNKTGVSWPSFQRTVKTTLMPHLIPPSVLTQHILKAMSLVWELSVQ